MLSLREMAERDDRPREDHIIILKGMTWRDYERHLEARGDRSAPRLAYLEGLLEIMSPSMDHEAIKSRIGCLVEAYCLHHGIEFEVLGSWTLKDREAERGVEPDECYVFGTGNRARPHLAIEVEWTAGGLNKLEIYRKLDVEEVWWWRKGRIRTFALRGEEYVETVRSGVLPDIDLDLLTSFLDRPRTSQAIRDYTAALQNRG
jgi:Uma2 family endonuclease